MRVSRSTALVVVLLSMLSSALAVSRATAQVPRTLKDSGDPVFPVFEGWYDNPDGSFTLLVGYFNQNLKQTVEIPIGEDNYLSPGVPDRGQPTIFEPGRGWGIFTIQVPADFGDGTVDWTLTANSQTVTIPMHLRAEWYVEPHQDAANGNEPPIVRFAPDGAAHQGPPIGIAQTLSASVGTPLELSVWTSDKKPTLNVRQNPRFTRPALILLWNVLRGPGDVEFSAGVQEFEDSSDQNPKTTGTFGEPGEYLLRVEALDESGEGGGGFQCCWTSAHVRVNVL